MEMERGRGGWQRRPRAQRQEMVYGLRPVVEAVEAGREIERIILREGIERSEDLSTLQRIARQRRIPVQYVPGMWFARLGSRNHQGMVAYLSPIEYQDLPEIVTSTFERGEEPLLVLADGITDVHNIGAIARTAECVGAQALVVPMRGSAQLGADAIKTSAGALSHIAVCRVESIARAVRFLQASGIRVFAASETGASLHTRTSLTGPLAVVLGDEFEGVSSEVLKMVDGSVRVPIHGSVESLNVSVAAGIILYEVERQRHLEA